MVFVRQRHGIVHSLKKIKMKRKKRDYFFVQSLCICNQPSYKWMTLVCQSRDWNFLFYFCNLIDTIRETVDNGVYLNHNLSSYCLERVNWYQPENQKFSLKMVFINFEKEDNFFLNYEYFNLEGIIWKTCIRNTFVLFITTRPHKNALISKFYYISFLQ